ncbi:hypothetical protein ABIB62_002283 [Mucilaginibacter sp. UYP25]|uniref:hypothetical protein n=1 Tax=unclassified Mucilaginibacter TaxID=2617802 RepID=UPI003395FEF0
MFKTYKHSHFLPDAFGHGGNKRTAQIEHLLSEAGISADDADLSYTIATGNKLSHYLVGLQQNMTLRTGNKNKYAIGRYKAVFEQFVKQYKPGLFIWESTVEYHLILAEVLYKYHVPVIALPHNLESLVAGAKSVFSNKPAPLWLSEEMNYLKLCNKVFTISQEEHWLASNYGVNAGYLPYYPAPTAESFLLDIRQRRSIVTAKPDTKQQNILLLGTFHNQPTFTGFTELLQYIRAIPGLKINVAGFGSEKLKDLFTGNNIQIWGSVNNETLADLITIADCAIVHQQPSSGALTRIPELLIAGLPVIANTHAARSCPPAQGLMVYDSYDELKKILRSGDFAIPPFLVQPRQEQAFVDYVKTLIIKSQV